MKNGRGKERYEIETIHYLSNLDSHRKDAEVAWFDKLTMIGIARSPEPVEGV